MAALSQHGSKFTYIPSGQEGVHFFVFCCWQASRLCWIYWIWTNPFLDSQMTFLGPLFSQIRFKFQIFYLIKRREDNPEFKKTGCACIRSTALPRGQCVSVMIYEVTLISAHNPNLTSTWTANHTWTLLTPCNLWIKETTCNPGC